VERNNTEKNFIQNWLQAPLHSRFLESNKGRFKSREQDSLYTRLLERNKAEEGYIEDRLQATIHPRLVEANGLNLNRIYLLRNESRTLQTNLILVIFV
jgi:hypothetical protein